MLYKSLEILTKTILRIINGKTHIMNKDLIPKGNYILIAPHRTWLDPVLYAHAAYPKEFGFIAKSSLFKEPVVSYILRHTHGVSVDRKHPGLSVINKPVQILDNTNLSMIMFPSGTRHSQKLKGGAALIAKIANVPLVPAVYQGPLTFRDLFSRKPMYINFGNPIHVDTNRILNKEYRNEIINRMQTSFKYLDDQINPKYHYVDVSRKHLVER